jgi:hypothetical protein
VAQKYSLVRSQHIIELWFRLLFDILDDEQLTTELWNQLKGIFKIETNPKEFVVAHLPEDI